MERIIAGFLFIIVGTSALLKKRINFEGTNGYLTDATAIIIGLVLIIIGLYALLFK